MGLSTVVSRLATFEVTEENFLKTAKFWRALRKGRAKLKIHASMYPVILDFENIAFCLHGEADVDVLIAGVREKLKKAWLTP